MSGSDIVRAFRNRETDRPGLFNLRNWRGRVIAIGVATSAVAMGSIIVKAADDSGVYDVARQYNPVRSVVRSVQLPSIFVPRQPQVVRTSLSYAPVFQSLMPAPATGKRSIDTPRGEERRASLSGTARKIKLSPAPSRTVNDEDFAESYIDQRTSYCVRTCDGFFFPVGNPSGGDLAAHEAACERACPTAETSVYVAPAGSSGIEAAVNRRGQRYDALKTAFNHRTQIDNACSCNAGPARNYSVMSDFTLRKGDLVMSREGLKVFRGGEQFPLRGADFARADTTKFSAEERRALEKIEASSMRGNATATLSPGLKARISAQVNATRPVAAAASAARTVAMARKVQTVNGRELRYVGPDMDFDRGR